MPSNDPRLYSMRLSITAAKIQVATNSFLSKRPILKTAGAEDGSSPDVYYTEADGISFLEALWRATPHSVRLVQHTEDGYGLSVSPATLDQYPLNSDLPSEATHLIATLNPPLCGREIFELMERLNEIIKFQESNPDQSMTDLNEDVKGQSYNSSIDVIDPAKVLMTAEEVRQYLK